MCTQNLKKKKEKKIEKIQIIWGIYLSGGYLVDYNLFHKFYEFLINIYFESFCKFYFIML